MNSRPRMVDRLTTLSSPSLLQKRAIAKGRSAEMLITTALFRLAASLLKRRAEAWQVGVSRLGTMFSTLRLPAKLSSEMFCKSLFTSEKGGATLPTCGNSPYSFTGEPPSVGVGVVLLAMLFSFG